MHKNHTFTIKPKKLKPKKMNEVQNILIEDDVIIIITTDGNRRTLPIKTNNEVHRTWISNIIAMAESLVMETDEDITEGLNWTGENPWQDNYGDVDDLDDDWL